MKVLKPWKYDSVPLESTLGTDFENIHIWCPNTMLYVQGKAKMNLFSNMNGAYDVRLYIMFWKMISLKKQLTFCDTTTGFLVKQRLRNKHRNYILMTCHYPDLGSGPDWLKQISQVAQPRAKGHGGDPCSPHLRPSSNAVLHTR